MQTQFVKITEENKKEAIKKAGRIIKSGGLVVFPTETVYGLGADALNVKAVKRIFKAKGRPSDNPIIVHVGNASQLKLLAENVSENHKKLSKKFWPGPLTLVFKKKREISDAVSGGLPTIALRMPENTLARELIKSAGTPIAAPSANISGRPSGTSGKDIFDELKGKVEMVLDAGPSKIGVESTVLKLTDDSALILRPGAVTKEMLQRVLKTFPVIFAKNKKDLHASPGTKYRHYAPEAKLEILSPLKILSRAETLEKKNKKIGIITAKKYEKYLKKYKPNVFILGDEKKLPQISRNLYKALRFFDDKKIDVILCQSFKEKGLGTAIMDRLKRASSENN